MTEFDDPDGTQVISTDSRKAAVRCLGALAFSGLGLGFPAVFPPHEPFDARAAVLIFSGMFFGLVAAKNLLLIIVPQRLTLMRSGFHFDGLRSGEIPWAMVEQFRISRNGHAVVFRLHSGIRRPKLPSILPWVSESNADGWIPHSLTADPRELLRILEGRRIQFEAKQND